MRWYGNFWWLSIYFVYMWKTVGWKRYGCISEELQTKKNTHPKELSFKRTVYFPLSVAVSSCCQWLHCFVQERGHRFGGCNRNPIARTVHCFLAFAFFPKNSCYFNIGNIIWLGRLSWPMMLNSSYFTRHIYGELTGKGIRQWQRQSWCSGLCLSAGMRFTGESSLIFHGTPLGSGFQKTDFWGLHSYKAPHPTL